MAMVYMHRSSSRTVLGKKIRWGDHVRCAPREGGWRQRGDVSRQRGGHAHDGVVIGVCIPMDYAAGRCVALTSEACRGSANDLPSEQRHVERRKASQQAADHGRLSQDSIAKRV